MPLKNTLNVSELLKRLGVVGDSKASAELLDQIRLGVTIADLSNLVAPVDVPRASSSGLLNSGINQVAGATLQCLSAGGLRVDSINGTNLTRELKIWKNTVDDLSAFNHTIMPKLELTFGQTTQSIFSNISTHAFIFPSFAYTVEQTTNILSDVFPNLWLGPGEFLMFEIFDTNTDTTLHLSWTEFPAMLNP